MPFFISSIKNVINRQFEMLTASSMHDRNNESRRFVETVLWQDNAQRQQKAHKFQRWSTLTPNTVRVVLTSYITRCNQLG